MSSEDTLQPALLSLEQFAEMTDTFWKTMLGIEPS